MKIIASQNGIEAARKAYELLSAGEDIVDAVVEGIALVEDDPEELTVGYGGLPNADGIVELDASVMDGRTQRFGSVAALRNIRHPSRVAKLVLQQSDRVLFAGEGALAFALAHGFQQEDLVTEKARKIWEHWRATTDETWRPPDDAQLDPEVSAYLATHSSRPQGTVHAAALDDAGNLANCTSTSGHAFKPPGRVGDTPIAGAGFYLENGVGSCGSLGNGEANLRCLTSFFAVEQMRQGRTPQQAGLAALQRVADAVSPNVDVRLYLLRADGEHAGVCMSGQRKIAVAVASGVRLEDCTPLEDRG